MLAKYVSKNVIELNMSNMSFTNYLGASILPQRKQYVDGLRGLSMIVVVYGHCLLAESLTSYTAFFVFLVQ